MDELIKELESFKDQTSAFTVADVAIVMVLGFALTLVVAATYRFTHRGTSYSQSFAQALVVMGMVTAVIMLIVGSNIARAFSLVGALSVIRFRNAVKETRDVAFMFVVMAIGMACGTGFYLLAALTTAILSAVAVLMFKLNAFERRVGERLLRVRLPPDQDPDRAFEPAFRNLLIDSRLVSVETVAGGTLQEAVYSVALKDGSTQQALLQALRELNGNNKVVLVVGQQEVDL